ncbi:unnamed protein product [Brugia timori]|uniref:Uncharacterized protein n=1 Tax=Brugia timori TaxID=42155 RepID=A0A0R3QI06_9BILA|nr:unnamed protein product [Brugia timori]
MNRKRQPVALNVTVDPICTSTNGSCSCSTQQLLYRINAIANNDNFIQRRFPRAIRRKRLRERLDATVALPQLLHLANKNWKNCRNVNEVQFLQLRG